jgi:Golgi nucleoside diphosphatase
MKWKWTRAPVEELEQNLKYAITIDSGSSGSRLEIYSWLDHDIAQSEANDTEIASLPVIQINGKQKKYFSLLCCG